MPHRTLEVEGMDPQQRYVLLRTQAPLPPSFARTLLTLVLHRLHSSAPFVITHPLFRFLAATTRPSFHSGSQRSHSVPKNCTTTTNHIRPYSSIVPPPTVPAKSAIERLADFGHPYHTRVPLHYRYHRCFKKSLLGVCL